VSGPDELPPTASRQPTAHPDGRDQIARDQTARDQAVSASTTRPAHPALLAYQASNARAMRIYAGVLAIVLVTAVLAVRTAYARGELTHVSRSSAPAAAPIPAGPTADALALAWHDADRPAAGTPVHEGVVITYDSHSVHGRDARTGELRWHYTRSDQTICSVLQQDASTIAIYNRHGNCDQVTGFVSATGALKWQRTMTDNGVTEAASAPNVVLTVARHSVHVIDNAGGLDRWNWVAPDRCSVNRALAGSQGVLISTTCGSEHRLVLRALTSDELKWTVTVPRAMVPVAASAFVGALDPSTGMLHSYSADKGADTRSGQLAEPAELRLALSRLPRASTAVDGFAASGEPVEVLWLGRLYSFAKTGTVNWSSAATGPATVLGSDVLALAAGSTVQRHAGATGRVLARVSLSPASAGAAVFPVGHGLLLAGTDTRMYQ
jgi:outer membrane protein assembly factor BamB